MYQSQKGRGDLPGINESDVIANLLPLAPVPMGAFVRTVANAVAVGAAVVGALTGPPPRALQPPPLAGRSGPHGGTPSCHDSVGSHELCPPGYHPGERDGADFASVRMCAVAGKASSPVCGRICGPGCVIWGPEARSFSTATARRRSGLSPNAGGRRLAQSRPGNPLHGSGRPGYGRTPPRRIKRIAGHHPPRPSRNGITPLRRRRCVKHHAWRMPPLRQERRPAGGSDSAQQRPD